MIARPPKHQKSFAARFREAYEMAERNGGVLPELPQPREDRSDLAARFRKAFEDAERGTGQPKEAPALAYWAKGVPAITAVEGIKRYLYADGSIDERSVVSPEVEARAYEIGGIAAQTEVIAEAETEEADEALDLQAAIVAEAAGPIAAREALAA